MKHDKFAVFILTHGRPDNIVTLDSLKKAGYTGKIYFIIDNEDETADRYHEKFGDQVLTFDKLSVSKTFDTADNFDDRRAIVYARNICFQFAKEMKLDHFIQLDDDYTQFQFRFDDKLRYKYMQIKSLDKVFDALIDFKISTGAKSVAMAQGGDFIGGIDGIKDGYKFKRKCMNTFICSTDDPFTFIGGINEDVNTYTRPASTGDLFFTSLIVSIVQKTTQHNSGGMTDIYLDGGTYKKSFYTVMYQPSSVKISEMITTHRRLHHRVDWRKTVPCILREEVKKVNG